MNVIINLIRNILLPYLEQDSRFANNKLNDSFCEAFANAIVRFENEPNQASELIQSLGLDIENANVNLEEIYNDFLSELAEYFVLGNNNELTAYLITSTNKTFENYVNSFRSIENSIKKTERSRLKLELPQLHNRLLFELPENYITTVIKKKAREDLKTKFKKWDDEIKEEKVSETEKPVAKIFAMSWVKYAIAACLLIVGSITLYITQNKHKLQYSESKKNNANTNTHELGNIYLKDKIYESHTLKNSIDSLLNNENGEPFVNRQISIIFENNLTDTVKYNIDTTELNNQRYYTFNYNKLIIFGKPFNSQCKVILLGKGMYYLKVDKRCFELKYNKNPTLLSKSIYLK